MKLNVRPVVNACMLAALLFVCRAHAQAQPATVAQSEAIPIAHLIANVSKKTGRKFLVDPRVKADVTLIGQNPASLDYAGLLSVLQLHGLAAVDQGEYVHVVPDAGVRNMPLPLVTGNESHPDAEYVGRIIPVRNVPAAQLVPLLRPLLPQQAHLVALPCRNVLMIADTFGNAKRIEKLVQALDTGEPYTPAKCGADPAPKT